MKFNASAENKYLFIPLIALILVLSLGTFQSQGVFDQWQLQLSDTLFTQNQPLNNIIILAIDDPSLQEIGRWPWDREIFVQLLPKLQEAKAVGIDVSFFEPYDTQIDQQLGDIMRTQANVIIPLQFTSFNTSQSLQAANVLRPIEELHTIPKGFVNIYSSDDGVTRFTQLTLSGQPSFALQVVNQSITLPSFPQERLPINFVGGPGTFPYISVKDVLQDNHNINFTNKIVLIGATSPGLQDNYFVPTSQGQAMPGVEIHAHIIQTLLTKKFLFETPLYLNILLIAIIISLISLSTLFLKQRYTNTLAISLIFIYYLIAFISFDNGYILNLIYPPIAIILTYASLTSYLFFAEGREKRKALKAFKQYVSPDVIKHLFNNPSQLKLGGERRDVTIFFSDVRGFTSISEKLTPEQLVHTLNRYLTVMTDVIIDKKGVVDKYIGDAIMAFWGAPLTNKNHANDAARTALNSLKKLKVLQKQFQKEGLPHIDIGIGLNSGPAVIGNMGSTKRFDYTAMGDTVNLASRLESLTKQYGVRILISQQTHNKIKSNFLCRELDKVQVKGKKQAITIFELISTQASATPEQKQYTQKYQEAFQSYQNQEFKKAIVLFKKCLAQKQDKAAELMIQRSQHFIKSPPPKEWNGSFEWKTK